MASSRIKTYGTNGTFVGIPGGHPLTSLLGLIIGGAAAGYVGQLEGKEYYRSEERRN